MGRLPRRRGAIDWLKTHRLAREALDELGVHVDSHARVGDLSLELQQEVEVARAVSANSKVLILDEATSALSEAATRAAAASASSSCATAASRSSSSRTGCARSTSCSLARHRAARRPADRHGPLPEHGRARARADDGRARDRRPLQQAHDRARRARALGAGPDTRGRDGDRRVLRGARAARSSASRASSAAARTSSRSRSAASCPPTARSASRATTVDCARRAAAMRAGIGLVPDDRKRSAILPTRSVQHNLSAAWMSRLSPARRRSTRARAQAGRRVGRRASASRRRRCDADRATSRAATSRRSCSRAGSRSSPDVIVLSEPTRGIDVGREERGLRADPGHGRARRRAC